MKCLHSGSEPIPRHAGDAVQLRLGFSAPRLHSGIKTHTRARTRTHKQTHHHTPTHHGTKRQRDFEISVQNGGEHTSSEAHIPLIQVAQTHTLTHTHTHTQHNTHTTHTHTHTHTPTNIQKCGNKLTKNTLKPKAKNLAGKQHTNKHKIAFSVSVGRDHCCVHVRFVESDGSAVRAGTEHAQLRLVRAHLHLPPDLLLHRLAQGQ